MRYFPRHPPLPEPTAQEAATLVEQWRESAPRIVTGWQGRKEGTPPENLTQKLIDDLKAYGYRLEAGEIVNPKGRATGVQVLLKNGRISCRVKTTNALLWSGPRIGDFLVSYWFATKVSAPC